MKTSTTTVPLGQPFARLAVAIAFIIAGCASSDAGGRKATVVKARATQQQQQKPVKLRYYGGPKYPMYRG
jgi:hypothetical protein